MYQYTVAYGENTQLWPLNQNIHSSSSNFLDWILYLKSASHLQHRVSDPFHQIWVRNIRIPSWQDRSIYYPNIPGLLIKFCGYDPQIIERYPFIHVMIEHQVISPGFQVHVQSVLVSRWKDSGFHQIHNIHFYFRTKRREVDSKQEKNNKLAFWWLRSHLWFLDCLLNLRNWDSFLTFRISISVLAWRKKLV